MIAIETLPEQRTLTVKLADPELDDWPSDMLLDGYRPRKPWHTEPASLRQLEALERRGWEPPADLTKGEAQKALLRPSRKMLAILIARDLWRPGDPPLTMGDASEMIERIACEEGWCR